jgi:Bacterial PH domain
MDTPSTTFAAAPLDLTARIVTGSVWALTGIFVLVGLGITAFVSAAPGLVMLAVGVLLVVPNAWMRRVEPHAYVVEDDVLSIRRRSASPRRFVGPLRNGRRGRLGWRVAGDGGGYGYLGRYRAEGRTVSAFVTDRARVVLLEVGGAGLAVSPVDPDGFIARVADGT